MPGTDLRPFENGLFECHGHLFMDGADFRQAKERHENGIDAACVRKELRALADAGVVYFRDGGDAYGVSSFAKTIAPEYGIRLVSPLFAIHKNGYYGKIVGRGFSDRKEYRSLVKQVRSGGGDLIKIMISGIVTFSKYGELSCPSLGEGEIRDLISIAHDAGFPVMVHANGDAAVRAAVLAGADSIEHGMFPEKETLELLAESKSVWVPTAAAIASFTRREGTDRQIAEETLRNHLSSIRFAAEKGALIAAGSDSGAVGVPHGSGTKEEYRLLKLAGVPAQVLASGNRKIEEVF